MSYDIDPSISLSFVGDLKDIANGSETLNESDNDNWSGQISVKTRLSTNPELQQEIDNSLAHLDNYFLKADESQPTRCIDGRRSETYEKDKLTTETIYGPQIPGGTPASAFIRHIVEGQIDNEKSTFIDDTNDLLNLFIHKGIYFGGHTDDHAKTPFTGCGAIDKLPEIIEKMTDPSAQSHLSTLVQAMLGDDFNEDIYSDMITKLGAFKGYQESYFEGSTDNLLYRQKIVDSLNSKSSEINNKPAVEKLIGQHNEVGLVINLVPGSSFDRDRFNSSSDGEIQLFNYDFWNTQHEADLLFPEENNDAQLNKHLQYITARASYAVATAMVLTDGTLKLIVRSQ